MAVDILTDLESMIKDMKNDRSKTRPSSILPEAEVMELQDYLKKFLAPYDFKVGDLVTPKENVNCGGRGKPYIVVQVTEGGKKSGVLDNLGNETNLRVAYRDPNGVVGAIWLEHYLFEKWDPSMERPE